MSMLEVKNLSKSFGDLEVLKDISFNVEKGEVVAVIGPSGSGKSTLLRCINQLERADGGVINVCGTDMLIKNSRGRTVYTDTKTLRAIRLKTGPATSRRLPCAYSRRTKPRQRKRLWLC